MGAVLSFPLQPRDHTRNRLRYMNRATVYAFPKEARPADSFAAHLNYMDAWTEFNCQAALVTASFVALYFKALGVSLRHRSNNMEQTTCPQKSRETPKLSPDGAP